MFSTFLVKKSNFIFKRLGLQLSYINKSEINKYKWLLKYSIDTIIDIGANEGQFAIKINKAIKPKQIFSFEPTSSAFSKLSKNAQKFNNIKPFKLGLGNENKPLEININSYSPSSSILELADFHKNSYPEFLENSKEIIEVRTLDYLVEKKEIILSENTLLKIDVQGFEKFVLQGAMETLKRIRIVYLEVSFIEMYSGQPLFKDIYDFLIKEGFQFLGADNLASDENTAQPLFFDAYFIQ